MYQHSICRPHRPVLAEHGSAAMGLFLEVPNLTPKSWDSRLGFAKPGVGAFHRHSYLNIPKLQEKLFLAQKVPYLLSSLHLASDAALLQFRTCKIIEGLNAFWIKCVMR